MKTQQEVARWLERTARDMHKRDEAECASLFLDEWHDISLSVGWMDGYDAATSSEYFSSRKEPTCALNAGLVKYNSYDCCDLMFMSLPYDRESGEVWNSLVTLSEDTDWNALAKWFLVSYREMRKEIEKGTLEL